MNEGRKEERLPGLGKCKREIRIEKVEKIIMEGKKM